MVKKIKEAPEGVKILAFAYFAGALVLMFLTMYTLNIADSARIGGALAVTMGLGPATFGPMVMIGIVLALFAILNYFIAREILRAKAWTRIVMGLFSVISLVISARSIITDGLYAGGSFGILLNGLILWYLFVKDSTKKFFK